MGAMLMYGGVQTKIVVNHKFVISLIHSRELVPLLVRPKCI
jgi:hypothetical protein